MDIREKIDLLPHSPGVYRYYDSEGKVIYVGKAKDLFKRVSQYFVPAERLNVKTRILVSKIADLQYSVVGSEADALLLENNLIKQYKPRYNILLKDSKTYPWICITADPFPKVFLTRRVVQNGSRYFGPYSSVLHARALVCVPRGALAAARQGLGCVPMGGSLGLWLRLGCCVPMGGLGLLPANFE